MTMSPASSRPCPCTSGAPYRLCCGPYHGGSTEAPDAPALMRSRYAGYVLRQVEYLHRTLHPAHEDRQRPREEVLRDLIRSCQQHRYLGLKVLDHSDPDEGATACVLFIARVFRQGRDLSFAERSEFQRAEGGWRYLRGETRSLAGLGPPPESLTLAGWATPVSDRQPSWPLP